MYTYEDYVGLDEYSMAIEDMMEEQREEAKNAVKNIVRQDMITSFLKILSSAKDYGCDEAEKLCDDLNLLQTHFLAIQNKVAEFESLVRRDATDAMVEALMEC